MDIEDLIMAFSNLQIQDDDDVEMLDVTKYPIEISLETKEDIENTDLIEVDLRKEVTESNDLAKEDIEIPREVDIVKETDSNLSTKINKIKKVSNHLASDESDVERDDTESESDVEKDRVVEISIKIPITIRINKRKRQ